MANQKSNHMKKQTKERKNVMKLIVPQISLFECRVCECKHTGQLRSGGRWKRGTWQCRNGCTLPIKNKKQIESKVNNNFNKPL